MTEASDAFFCVVLAVAAVTLLIPLGAFSAYFRIFRPLLEPHISSMANLPRSSTKDVSCGCFCCAHKPGGNSGRRQAATCASAELFAKHLVVMVNGLVGSASNWKFAAEQFRSRFGGEVLVHCSARNSSTSTFDGVDVMGHRLAEEVKEVIEESPSLTKISFVAHSLGGLVARFAIGQLFTPTKVVCHNTVEEPRNVEEQETPISLEEQDPDSDSSNGTILGLKPVNFVTIATPHIGQRGNWQVPFLCGFSFLEKVAASSVHWFVGRTGKHLCLSDSEGSQGALLRRMVSDCSQGLFISGLQAFQRRVVYANMNFDYVVGWRTATIRRECEMPKLKVQPLDLKYPHVIHTEDVLPNIHEPSAFRKPAFDPIEEEMIYALRRLSWQRVDVSFSGTIQKLTAHNTIQVKNFRTNSAGADVIAHIMDNFVL